MLVDAIQSSKFITEKKSNFLGWIFSLGENVKIIGPPEIVEQMKYETERLMRQYNISENK